jgi:predicted nuclease of predicted toxin-antitoxin system
VIFLVDENLSPRLCSFLATAADVAEHVGQAIGHGASDRVVLDYAVDHGAVIVTADTDFGTLIARSGRVDPSVILVRELLGLSVEDQGRLLAANLDQVRAVLDRGAIVVITKTASAFDLRPLPTG